MQTYEFKFRNEKTGFIQTIRTNGETQLEATKTACFIVGWKKNKLVFLSVILIRENAIDVFANSVNGGVFEVTD